MLAPAYNLDEHLFTESATLELLQIRWHPASPTDSHLLALLSDNSIRVYDVDSLRHVWRIGPTPTPQPVVIGSGSGVGGGSKHGSSASFVGSPGTAVASPGVTSKLAYLNSLGDTAVDFDIAPPRVVSSATGGSGSVGADTTFSPTTTLSTTSSTVTATKPAIAPKEGTLMNDSVIAQKNKKAPPTAGAGGTKVEWPIVILRGDGNVYVLCAGIDTNRPKLQGPISIQPQVDDNYGLDSCSLIVIPTLPPTVIIAESTGKTHHALFLEESCPLERSLTSEQLADSNLTLHPCEWYLHVLETVELELGLPSVEETKEAKSYSCPLHLKRDPLNEARYFAYHNAGLHAVTLDFTRPLHEFVQQEGTDELVEKYPLFNSHSRAEYVVCTKALQNANTNAVLGFTLLQSPSGLVLFLASGQVVSLDLITDHSLIRKWPLSGSTKKAGNSESPIKNMLKDSFQKRIQSILRSGLTQPILKLDQTTEPTPQEAFELLTQATRMLRENYFVRHDKARQEIEKREHVLKLLKQQQLNDIEELQAEKQKIRATAERLAETYEDLCDKQNSLFKRKRPIKVVTMAAFVEPHFDAWTQGSGNMSVVDKVPPEMLHMVHPHWNQFPPMNPLWHSILGFAIFMLGMISMTGNGCVMYIFTNTKSLRTPSNLLVVNLAFSDFFMMFTMGPPMVINCWHETNMAQEVVRLATLRLPKGSFSEKQFTERIEKIHQSVKMLQKNVDQAKQKITTQQMELEMKKKTAKEKTFTLPVKQEDIIKQIIGEMYTQIDSNPTTGENNRNYLKNSKPSLVSTSVRKYSKKTAAPERAYNSDSDSDSDDERDNTPRQRQRKERVRKWCTAPIVLGGARLILKVFHYPGNSEFWRRKMRTLHGVLDVNKDGVISYDDFMLLTEKFASLGHLDVKAKNEFRDIMRTTWEQQWGEITPYNLVTVEQYLTEMHHVVNDKDLKKKVHRFLPYLYKAVDKDRSGSISLNEFKLFFRCLGLTEENAAVSFAVIDKNGDGQITLDEFVKLGKDFFVSEKETHVSRMFWGPLVDH
uniref:Calmodulin n=1 Tax=Anopheles quadriannulatus TaxID=34691 RepID=A0A182XP30_ANOQN